VTVKSGNNGIAAKTKTNTKPR